MSDTGIITAQYVRIEQPPASIGDRIFAQLIDWGIQLSYIFLITWLSEPFEINTFWFILLWILPVVFYSLVCEVLNRGQSLGKMVLHLRVVKVDGSTPSLASFLLRWLLFVVDGPGTSFMGVIPIMITHNSQRLGDLAAGTMVVKLQDYRKIRVSLDDYDYLRQGYTPHYVQAADLSLEQVEIIRRTLAGGGSELSRQVAQLSEKVQQKMGIRRAESTDAAFLSRVMRDYQYYAIEEV